MRTSSHKCHRHNFLFMSVLRSVWKKKKTTNIKSLLKASLLNYVLAYVWYADICNDSKNTPLALFIISRKSMLARTFWILCLSEILLRTGRILVQNCPEVLTTLGLYFPVAIILRNSQYRDLELLSQVKQMLNPSDSDGYNFFCFHLQFMTK